MNEAAAFVSLKPEAFLGLNLRLGDRSVQTMINASHKCTGKELCAIT